MLLWSTEPDSGGLLAPVDSSLGRPRAFAFEISSPCACQYANMPIETCSGASYRRLECIRNRLGFQRFSCPVAQLSFICSHLSTCSKAPAPAMSSLDLCNCKSDLCWSQLLADLDFQTTNFMLHGSSRKPGACDGTVAALDSLLLAAHSA